MTATPLQTTQQPKPTLLSTLKLYRTSLQSRHSLLAELESALSSFLTSTPTSLTTLSSPSSEGTTIPSQLSTCAAESIRPPNEDELKEILRIGFEGVLDAKEEHRVIATSLEDLFERKDLRRIVEKIEHLEEERFKLMIERDQMRRLNMIADVGAGEFDRSVKNLEKRREELAQQIHEEEREIDAEVVDLSAAEEAEAPSDE